jgi:SAM-dependent methyltransferase
MTGVKRPERCVLCGAAGHLASAGFTQRYAQHGVSPLHVPWWECGRCGSWFGWPRPTPSQIALNWRVTPYNDARTEEVLAAFKLESQRFLLAALERRVPAKGRILDYGCNFGRFLEFARERGWDTVGVDAYGSAIEACRAKGLTVYQGWELDGLDLAAESLDAISSNDVFYYVWNPIGHLRRAYDLLRRGGAMVMRTTNKRFVAGALRRVVSSGERRDRALSTLLRSQFHAPTVHAVVRVMEKIGFRVDEVMPGAMTAPLSEYSVAARGAYALAGVLHSATRGRVNVSPGVWIVAVKPPARAAQRPRVTAAAVR